MFLNLPELLFLRPCIQPRHEVMHESVTHHTVDHVMGHWYRLHGTLHVKQLASSPIHHLSICSPIHPSFSHPSIIHLSSIFFHLPNVY